jgi:hypothetical protein
MSIRKILSLGSSSSSPSIKITIHEYFHPHEHVTNTYNAFKGTLLVEVCFVFPKGSNKSSKVFVRGVFLGSKGLGASGTTDDGV